MSRPPIPHCLVVLASAASGTPLVLPYPSQGGAAAAAPVLARALATGQGGWVAIYRGSAPEGEPLRRWGAHAERPEAWRRIRSVTTCVHPAALESFATLPGEPTLASALLAGITAAHAAAGVAMPEIAPRCLP